MTTLTKQQQSRVAYHIARGLQLAQPDLSLQELATGAAFILERVRPHTKDEYAWLEVAGWLIGRKVIKETQTPPWD